MLYPRLEDESLLLEKSSSTECSNLSCYPPKIFYGDKTTSQKVLIRNNWDRKIQLSSAMGKLQGEKWWKAYKNELKPGERATLRLLKKEIEALKEGEGLRLTIRHDQYPQLPFIQFRNIPILHISNAVTVLTKETSTGCYSIHLEIQEIITLDYKLEENVQQVTTEWKRVDIGGHQLNVSLISCNKRGKIKFRGIYNGMTYHWNVYFP